MRQHQNLAKIYSHQWRRPKRPRVKRAAVEKLGYGFTAIGLVASITLSGLIYLPRAGASNPYVASTVLGQSDGSHAPVFTTGNFNNETQINDHGVAIGGGDTVMDTVHHRFFEVDQGFRRVLVFNLDSNNNFTSYHANNVIGQPDFLTGTAVLSQNGFNSPLGIAYDGVHDRLFVSETSRERIMVFDLSGGITNGMNASWVIGQPNFTTNPNVGCIQAKCIVPGGIAYDPVNDYLFAADIALTRVQIFNLSGGISNNMDASFVLGDPDWSAATGGTSQNKFLACNGLSYDSASHQLFVADGLNNRIMIFDLTGGISNGMNASHVLGQAGFGTATPNTTQNGLKSQQSRLDYNGTTHILAAPDFQNNRIMLFDLTGGIADGMNASWELGQPDFVTGTSHAASQTGLNTPLSAKFDVVKNRLYVADSSHNRVMIYDMSSPSNNMNATAALNQTNRDTGGTNFFGSSQGDRLAYSYGLSFQTKSVVDAVNHRLFVADTFNNRVVVYSLDSNNDLSSNQATTVLGQPSLADNLASSAQNGMSQPTGLAFDSANNRLFVSEVGNSRVLVFNLSGGLSNGMNAANVLGQAGYGTAGTSNGQAGMSGPKGLAFDSTGHRLFVGDTANNRVLVFDTTSISDGMNASHVLGQAGYGVGGTATSQTGMSGPRGLVYDPGGNRLFVSDFTNNRVLVFSTSSISDGMAAANVLGQAGYGTATPNTTQNGLSGPSDTELDLTNHLLFVTETNNNRTGVFDISGGVSDNMNASYVLGQANFTTGSLALTQTGMDGPQAITYDPVGRRLYESDTAGSRLMVFNLVRLIASVPDGSAGTPYSVDLGSQGQGTTAYSLTGGSLPSGLVLNASTGTLSGTPLAGGTFNFSVHAADDNSTAGNYTDDKNYSLTITGGGSPSPSPPPPSPSPSPGPSPAPSPSPSPSSPSPSPSSSSTEIPPASTINLDDQTGFDNGSGYPVDVGPGDVLSFTTDDGQSHTVTIDTVQSPTVTVTFDDSPTRGIDTGQQITQDVTGDGNNDIGVGVVSITGNTSSMTFWRIVTASVPVISHSGLTTPTALHTLLSKPSLLRRLASHLPPSALLSFPWLLFALLATTIARLRYQAWQEGRARKALASSLAKEHELAEQKDNFITLISHYLRTPLTAISGGIELLAGSMEPALAGELNQVSGVLGARVNSLIQSIANRPELASLVSQPQALPGGQPSVFKSRWFRWPVLVTIATVGLADLLYVFDRNYSLGIVRILIQLAVGGLLAVLLYSAVRSHRNRQVLRQQSDKLLAEQQGLQKARTDAITESLEHISQPLEELQSKLVAVGDAKAAKPVLNGAKQLEDLIAKFKIAAALETGSVGSVVELVNFSDLVKEITQSYQSEILKKRLSIRSEDVKNSAIQNRALLRLVLDSVVNNAVKYSPEGSDIVITTRSAGGAGNPAEIIVKDSGPGIPADKLEQLFKPFSRAEQAAQDFDQPGVGLSLYLDKLVMSYLGGGIDVQAGQGGGTSVSIKVPGYSAVQAPKTDSQVYGLIPQAFHPVSAITAGGTKPLTG